MEIGNNYILIIIKTLHAPFTCKQVMVATIAASPDAPAHGLEHDTFMLLCGIEECFHRVYQVSKGKGRG